MTSSRTTKESKIDFLSDYDIELYINDISSFKKNDKWLEPFGPIMVKWPFKPKSTIDKDWLSRLILFKDEVRIDFLIAEQNKIDEKRYKNGYEILIDKDGLTKNLKEPTYSEFIIKNRQKKSMKNYQMNFGGQLIMCLNIYGEMNCLLLNICLILP